MEIKLYPIETDKSYNFLIGSREKPDRALKEGIRREITAAMGELGVPGDRLSVSVIQDSPEPSSSSEIPELKVRERYLLFVLLSSDGSPLSEEELEEQKREIAREFRVPQDSTIALVLLRDCFVTLLKSGEYGKPSVTII